MTEEKDPRTYLQAWYDIAMANPWIGPPLTDIFAYGHGEHAMREGDIAHHVGICETAEQLVGYLSQDTGWCLGQAFAWRDQCYINQTLGSEWLALKRGTEFESCSGSLFEGERGLEFVNAVDAATEAECKERTFLREDFYA